MVNAVEHGGVPEDEVAVAVRGTAAEVRVTLHHAGAPFPTPSARTPDAVRGRGLEMARALVDDLEHEVDDTGHTWTLSVRAG